jgi:hypothetical protein
MRARQASKEGAELGAQQAVALEEEPGTPVKPLGAMRHPTEVKQNLVADQYVFDHLLGGLYMKFPRTLLKFPIRVKNKLVRIYKGLP